MSDHRDRVAMVTGASRGSGRTMVRDLAKKGTPVGLIDINFSMAESAAQQLRAKRLRLLASPGDGSNSCLSSGW